MNTSTALASKDYWEEQWVSILPHCNFPLIEDVSIHLPAQKGLDFFEVGCAPGGILAQFCARMGYIAHGIDYASDPKLIIDYLHRERVQTGNIVQADFLTWCPERKYDIVASFGFIEHFNDPTPVVDQHFSLVKPGGTVIITMPNFARGQKILHWLFDRENLRRHNTRCMNLRFLQSAARRHNADLVTAKYSGGNFDFWTEPQQRMWRMEHLVKRITLILKRAFAWLPIKENALFSPYIVAIYRSK